MKDQYIYLQHILESIAWIEEYTSTGRDQFLASRMAQDATLAILDDDLAVTVVRIGHRKDVYR